MSLEGYSKCRIQHHSNDQGRAVRNYSERSLIELRQYELGDYSLRAVDVENKATEIFNIPFQNSDQYERGMGDSQPDKIQARSGIYSLWLNKDTRNQFHEALDNCITKLQVERRRDSSIDSRATDSDEPNISGTSIASNDTDAEIRDINVDASKELLLNIHHLSKHIEKGDKEAAAQLASKLASQNIRLQGQAYKKKNEEEPFQINVQIDGDEYSINQNGGIIPLEVFQFTTVRELRAAFEFAYQFPPTNQYFFVNGRLAHDEQTMKDLYVGPNSLFILFFLSHPRRFKETGAWTCSICNRNNDQNYLRCTTCTAERTY